MTSAKTDINRMRLRGWSEAFSMQWNGLTFWIAVRQQLNIMFVAEFLQWWWYHTAGAQIDLCYGRFDCAICVQIDQRLCIQISNAQLCDFLLLCICFQNVPQFLQIAQCSRDRMTAPFDGTFLWHGRCIDWGNRWLLSSRVMSILKPTRTIAIGMTINIASGLWMIGQYEVVQIVNAQNAQQTINSWFQIFRTRPINENLCAYFDATAFMFNYLSC